MRTAWILAALGAAVLTAGCAAVAVGAVGGFVISQEVAKDKTVHARIDLPAHQTWLAVKSFMSNKSPELLEVDEEHRVVTGRVYAAKTTVEVADYNETQTELRVYAKKAGFNDVEAAQYVLEQLYQVLEESQSSQDASGAAAAAPAAAE